MHDRALRFSCHVFLLIVEIDLKIPAKLKPIWSFQFTRSPAAAARAPLNQHSRASES
jgi:hypothetical protein